MYNKTFSLNLSPSLESSELAGTEYS